MKKFYAFLMVAVLRIRCSYCAQDESYFTKVGLQEQSFNGNPNSAQLQLYRQMSCGMKNCYKTACCGSGIYASCCSIPNSYCCGAKNCCPNASICCGQDCCTAGVAYCRDGRECVKINSSPTFKTPPVWIFVSLLLQLNIRFDHVSVIFRIYFTIVHLWQK